jgi:predicted DNA-binding transcriptional regulator AlpA
MKTTWITIPEAAQIANISASAIYYAIAQKRLPKRYRRGNLVVSEEDVRNWEATRRQRGRRVGYAASDEQKARIAAGQKLRWAQRKQAGK